MSIARRLWILFVAQVVMTAGFSLSFPFFALYLNQVRGVPMGLVGVFLAITMLLGAAGHALGGELSDVLGRRRVMLLSMWLRSAVVAVLAASIWLDWSVAAIVSINFVSGSLASFYRPAAHSWVADHIGSEERVQAYGMLRVAMNIGWAMGPAVGGWLAQRSYPLAFSVTAVAGVVCALILSFGIRDKEGFRRRSGTFSMGGLLSASSDRRFFAFCAFGMLIGLIMWQFVAPLSVHAVEYAGLEEAQVGWLFSLNGLVVIMLQSWASKRLSRYRITTALAGGALFYAAGYSLLGFGYGFLQLALCIVVITLGEIAVSPGVQALAVNLAPEGMTGRYSGMSGLMFHIGVAMGPLVGGLGIQYLSPYQPCLPWLIIGIAAMAASLGFLSLRGSLSLREEGLPEPAASLQGVPAA